MTESTARALRSLFRLNFLNKQKSPEILIEMEKIILKKAFNNLNVDDIKFVVDNWHEYLQAEIIKADQDDKQLSLFANSQF